MIGKVLKLLVVLLIVVAGYGYFLEYRSPGQWSSVWNNFKTTESVGTLAKDSIKVLRGNKVPLASISIEEMEQLVYRWEDQNGDTHLSYQMPQGVENVEIIRLGELNYNVQQSLTKDKKQQILGNPDR